MHSLLLLLLLFLPTTTNASHFNGGTITWAPIDPYANSSAINIAITQSYSWSYPTVTCTTNVPISTGTYSSSNTFLTCVSDCATDGGYSTTPIDILTDCTSYSTSLGMMSSERSVNITLNSSAYFYISYTGSAWRKLNDPAESGLGWSILTLIDLRIREDGFINTPPVATIVSPQYVIVNTTTQIEIPITDVNAGDDIRCRWSIYRAGYRRRRQIDEDSFVDSEFIDDTNQSLTVNRDSAHIRDKRQGCSSCNSGTCWNNCRCSCSACDDTTCTGNRCSTSPFCPAVTTTTRTTLSTSSFLHPPIDECGGICYPGGLPNDTTLSNCTITFTGLIPDTWYAISIQVEDFINETSTTPMSSVPVQFLIYVLPTPSCTILPLILPLTSCLEVETGVTINITMYAMNLCGSTVTITDIIVSKGITGMVASNLRNSATNSSLVYVIFTWTPQSNQIGTQELCTTAFNDLFVQSTQYCVDFTVTSSTPNCTVTTTTVASSVTEAPSKSSSNINVPLIVGLSLLALLLSLCFCCCLLYYLCWGAPARRRRQKQCKDGLPTQKYSLLNSLVIPRNFPFKTPKERYVIHNACDNRSSTYTAQSRTQSTVSSTLKTQISSNNTKNIKPIDITRINSINQSFTDDNTILELSQHQPIDNISIPPYSNIPMENIQKSAEKNQDRNNNSEKSSLPKVHVTKKLRKKQSKSDILTKSDGNTTKQSNDMNVEPNNTSDDLMVTESKIVKDNGEPINNVQLKEATVPNDRRSTVIKVKAGNLHNQRRRTDPDDENIDSHGLTEEYPQRMSSVSVVKLKRLPSKISKPKDNNKSTVQENNAVTITAISRKKSNARTRSLSNGRNIVDDIEMS